MLQGKGEGKKGPSEVVIESYGLQLITKCKTTYRQNEKHKHSGLPGEYFLSLPGGYFLSL